ncbi:hypothetical protein C8R45DRAFT_832855, partial [Mycena sanguinolenta]
PHGPKPLNDWAQQHLSAILKATTQTEFDSAFDAFVSKNATITVNGKKVSRDEYQKQLQGEGFDEAGATVQFSGAVEAGSIQVGVEATNCSKYDSYEVQAGVVGLFYTATIMEHIVVRDAPVEKHITSSLNLVYVKFRPLLDFKLKYLSGSRRMSPWPDPTGPKGRTDSLVCVSSAL